MIYFVQAGENGPIKIGTAIDIETRLSELQCGSPQKLKLLATMKGGAKIERLLHSAFLKYRTRGEWFEPSPEILEYIESRKIPETADNPRSVRDAKLLKLVFLNHNDNDLAGVEATRLSSFLRDLANTCAKSFSTYLDAPPKMTITETDPNQALIMAWALMGILGASADRMGNRELAGKLNGACSALSKLRKLVAKQTLSE